MTLVVRVCSPLIVATAKGSGKPAVHDKPELLYVETYQRTEQIALVEAIGSDNCWLSAGPFEAQRGNGDGVVDALVTRRLGWPAASMLADGFCSGGDT